MQPTTAERKRRYALMRQETDQPWCWACGRHEHDVPPFWASVFTLERSHIIGGPARKLDTRDTILLCSLCHRLNHRAVFRIDGRVLPWLERAKMLWLKRERDPDDWDPEFLQRLADGWIGRLPDPEEPDRWFMDQYQQRMACW